MPSRAARPTIKQFAHEYFTRVNFVNVYGRNVGFDYDFILEEIHRTFPAARTSKTWLRLMAYEIAGTVRMPMRRRTRRGLAEDFAMSLLVRRAGKHAHHDVVKLTHKKFPDQKLTNRDMRRLDVRLRSLKFTVPPRT